MKRSAPLVAALALLAAVPSALALYEVWDEGVWPRTWPKELEPLRKQARTLEGPEVLNRHYEIPFTKRDEFESAWPHLLKVKSKGAPLILLRRPPMNLYTLKAGVIVHTPPVNTDVRANPETPIPGQDNPRVTWMRTTFVELVVDGDVVDLNRIPLPPDTPIIDERFDRARAASTPG